MARYCACFVMVAFVLLGLSASPAAAQTGWRLSASGIVGASLPLTVDGLRISDPTVPFDLTIDGGKNKKAPVLGGRFSIFKRRARGIELGALLDLRTFRYDGIAGEPTHVTGTAGGERVDEIELSAGDETRVTMLMAALIARMPVGRTIDRPEGLVIPYVGAGGGNQHASIKTPPAFTTNAPTLLGLAGVELPVSARLSLFAEYRFEKLRDEVLQDTTRVNITLRTYHVASGIAFRF